MIEAMLGTGEHCLTMLREQSRWPNSIYVRCPPCGGEMCGMVQGERFERERCRNQTSLTADTVMAATKLRLTGWFLTIYLVSQAKAGGSALAVNGQLGSRFPTIWRICYKLMKEIVGRGNRHVLHGDVQTDDAGIGGLRPQRQLRREEESG